MSQHIFISHATKDDEVVSRLMEALAAETGGEFWVDHHHLTPPEDNWRQAIQEALRNCMAGLLILSRHSVSRPEIMSEWTYLLNVHRDLYVAKIDGVPVEDIDYRLHLVQWVDLSKDWDKGVQTLAAAIRGDDTPEDAPVMTPRPVTGHIDRKLLAIPIHGRDYGLTTLETRMEHGPTTILGIGGVGKSRLAAEVAMSSPNIDGVIWHRCSDVSQPDDVVMLLRQHLNLAPSVPRHQVLESLRTHHLLVVIDNAEAVPEERQAAFVLLIEQLYAAGAKVLVTSRSEWDELEIGETYRPQRPSREAAVKIVQEMQDAFRSPHDLASYAERMVDAARQHPGLLEWGVKQTRRFEPNKVIRDLRRLKSKRMQEALDEMIHKTLRQMVRQEGKGVRDALRRLVIFRGGFSYEAAHAVLELDEDTLDFCLETLVAWQFVNVTADRGMARYWVDPLVIGFIECDETARPLHYAYYQSLAEQCYAEGNFRTLSTEIGNFKVARAYAMIHDAKFAEWLSARWTEITVEQTGGPV